MQSTGHSGFILRVGCSWTILALYRRVGIVTNRITDRIQGRQALLKTDIYCLRRLSILDPIYKASHTFLGYCQISVPVSG